MAPKSSKTTLRQSTLSFGAAKSTAAASKAKKASASTTTEPASSSSRSKRTEKPSKVDADSSDEEVISADDIELSKSDSGSQESEIEDVDDDLEKVEARAQAELPTERRAKGKTAVVKSEASDALAVESLEQKAKAEEKKPAVDVSSRPHLNVKSAEYSDIWLDTREKMGHMRPTHVLKDQNRVDDILRIFDMNYEYGPCIGMTRLERWERAKAIGLSPPTEVYDILMTQEGLTDSRYSESVLAGQV
ncbi:hypothetical protein EST38_g14468 [Candolleomyces aberdarensis]|uniref:DNA polymerase delta subunit 4 n=1 Tax=Candolleomyces aberdarensis TaxID=2316362 RepID=A0A4Q2CZ10_9AGAR|nr:hypothetical protein EST38_g14468 [Candolleomyces aberdarensis]